MNTHNPLDLLQRRSYTLTQNLKTNFKGGLLCLLCCSMSSFAWLPVKNDVIYLCSSSPVWNELFELFFFELFSVFYFSSDWLPLRSLCSWWAGLLTQVEKILLSHVHWPHYSSVLFAYTAYLQRQDVNSGIGCLNNSYVPFCVLRTWIVLEVKSSHSHIKHPHTLKQTWLVLFYQSSKVIKRECVSVRFVSQCVLYILYSSASTRLHFVVNTDICMWLFQGTEVETL